MMKSLSFISILLLTLCLFCSDLKKEYYPSGKIKSETLIEKNKSGWIKKYYENGKMMGFAQLANGQFHGKGIFYSKSGIKAVEIDFKNGIPDGIQKTYYLSRKLQSVSMLKNGRMTGITKLYYESGRIAATWDYRSKKIKGKSFYETGEMDTIYEYDDITLLRMIKYDKKRNPINGEYRSYFNSGKIQVHGFFINGIPQRIYHSYYESGKLNYEGGFKNGVPMGIHKAYYEDGHFDRIIPYENGKINGTVLIYHPIMDIVIDRIKYKIGKKVE